jgi:hypothetical protein
VASLERQELPILAFEQKELQRSASSSSSKRTCLLVMLFKLKTSPHQTSSVFFLLLPMELILSTIHSEVCSQNLLVLKDLLSYQDRNRLSPRNYPKHLRELLTEKQWGYWHVLGGEDASNVAEIQVDSLFYFAGHSYQVVVVEDDQVRETIQFGARNRIPLQPGQGLLKVWESPFLYNCPFSHLVGEVIIYRQILGISIGWLIYLFLVLLDDMDWYGLVLFVRSGCSW